MHLVVISFSNLTDALDGWMACVCNPYSFTLSFLRLMPFQEASRSQRGQIPVGFSFCCASNTEVLCRSFFSFLPPALRMLLLPEDSASGKDDATETGKPSVEWIQDFLRKRYLVTILGSQQVL